LLLAVDQYIFV